MLFGFRRSESRKEWWREEGRRGGDKEKRRVDEDNGSGYTLEDKSVSAKDVGVCMERVRRPKEKKKKKSRVPFFFVPPPKA